MIKAMLMRYVLALLVIVAWSMVEVEATTQVEEVVESDGWAHRHPATTNTAVSPIR